MFNPAIAERQVGQFPLSMGTSLAFEGLLGIYPEREDKTIYLTGYGEMWINLRTLYRNFMGSLSKDAIQGIIPSQVDEALRQEMDAIKQIVSEHTHGRCSVVFYVSNYADLQKKYPHAKLRVDRTEKQMEYTEIKMQSLQLMLKYFEQQGGEDIRVFKLNLFPTKQHKTLILTHFAYDLLSWKAFSELTLIESNTGVVKKRPLWYTKYLGGKELAMIPFREDFLQVFGDSRTFSPMSMKIRNAVIDLAKQFNWTQVTTDDKVRLNIGFLRDEETKKLLQSLLV